MAPLKLIGERENVEEERERYREVNKVEVTLSLKLFPLSYLFFCDTIFESSEKWLKEEERRIKREMLLFFLAFSFLTSTVMMMMVMMGFPKLAASKCREVNSKLSAGISTKPPAI